MECNHLVWRCLCGKQQPSACCTERRVDSSFSWLSCWRPWGSLRQRVGPASTRAFPVPNQTGLCCDTPLAPLYSPNANIRSQILFFWILTPEVWDLMQEVEPDGFIILGVEFENGTFSRSLAAGQWGSSLVAAGRADECGQPSPTRRRSALTLEWPLSADWEKSRKAGMPGSTWLPGSFLSHQEQGQT